MYYVTEPIPNSIKVTKAGRLRILFANCALRHIFSDLRNLRAHLQTNLRFRNLRFKKVTKQMRKLRKQF